MPNRFSSIAIAWLLCSVSIHIQAADTSPDSNAANSSPISPGAAEPSSPTDWFGAPVRPTEARTAAEELSGFHLPEGFTIELFASEPEIAKPLNMAFDFSGRLWITDTVEYPYPAPADREPRDSIKILEDTDGDHRADRVTVFADKLNVPIGLVPYGDGVIAFSIPNLYHFRDTDGDGVCDQRDVILGPFDTTRDTHGMVNALRQGYDGWIYACHGFNNQSAVQGKDGWQVEMTSGNTFRFRPDGSRIEHVTHGQVNPFGMTHDEWGNWFTADCHSKPITQLLRGGYYSSFGRPDDGLGFVPPMMDHLHGSTAISGIVLYNGDNFPATYRNQFYSGNVMTSRINRNALTQTGATLKAHELPDFLTSDDPWFRPVDLQIAPDGSLYVADFYNRIIGHYEVPLDHEGRDRHRGRIWKISNSESPPTAANDTFFGTDQSQLLQKLNYVADSTTKKAESIRQRFFAEAGSATPEEFWLRFRRNQLTESQWLAAANDLDPRMRTHAMLVAGEMPTDWSSEIREAVHQRLQDTEPFVARAAAEACGRHPGLESVDLLLAKLAQVDVADKIMTQTIRIAVRNSLLNPEIAKTLNASTHLGGGNADAFISILLGTNSPDAGRWLATYLKQTTATDKDQMPIIRHAIKTLPADEIAGLVQTLRERIGNHLPKAKEILLEIATAGASQSPSAREWALEFSRSEWLKAIEPLAKQSTTRLSWRRSDSTGHWPMELRESPSGEKRNYHSSFKLGESYVGTVRSAPFAATDSLSFQLAGHDGLPKDPIDATNEVRLVDANTGTVLRRAAPPRNDKALQIEWNLEDVLGQMVVIEVVDGNAKPSYAWIAFGQFTDSRFNDDPLSDELKNWFEIVSKYKLDELAPDIAALLQRTNTLSRESRLELVSGLVNLRQSNASIAIVDVIRVLPNATSLLQSLEPTIVAGVKEPFALDWLKTAASGLTRSEQQSLAKTLAKRRESLPWLVTAATEGWISGDVLRLKEVESSLASLASSELKLLADEVLATLPDEDNEQAKLTAQAYTHFQANGGDAIAGLGVFQKHCIACHQIQGVGAIVGPQLDGIGVRGASRLLEDILQPDRNVDRAFRASSFVLEDGTVTVGLVRNETPTTIEVITNDGKPKMLDVNEIEARQTTTRSLMPTGMHEAIGTSGLNNLLAYLLTQRPDPNSGQSE